MSIISGIGLSSNQKSPIFGQNSASAYRDLVANALQMVPWKQIDGNFQRLFFLQ
jgi:hypothetical protein